jgi:hypothetical protein
MRSWLMVACGTALIVALTLLKPCAYLPNACSWIAMAAIPVGIVGLAVGGVWQTRARLRRMSTPELEGLVWHYEPECFDFLGSAQSSVVEFRRIVESRDLVELSRRWRALANDFVQREREAGHHGRPLIMDYYLDHSEAIAELARRSRTQPDVGGV